MPPSCVTLGGFEIGAWVALLWQHNANQLQVRTRSVSECSVLAVCVVHLVSQPVSMFTGYHFAIFCCTENKLKTRHRASTSMYSLTFRVRVMLS